MNMDINEARRLVNEASDDEPAVLPRSVLRELTVDDVPDEAAFQVGATEDGVIHLDWEGKVDIKASLASLPEPDKENAHKLIGRLHNKIHTLPTINYYEERSQDYDKVLTIFVRANSAGTPLEYSDLLLSTATAKWEKLNARDEIVRLVGDLNDLGGGDGYRFGKDFVLKASLYLTSDLPIQYKVKNFTKPNLRKIEDNWENIKIYLNTTVRLVAKFGYRWENIVAPLALLSISFWLLKNGKEKFAKSSQRDDVATQSEIRKWLTLAWLKNSFGGSSDTTLKNLRDVLLTINTYEVFPSDELNAALKIESRLSDAEVEALLAYNYRGKYTYLVLSLLYPDRDWKDVEGGQQERDGLRLALHRALLVSVLCQHDVAVETNQTVNPVEAGFDPVGLSRAEAPQSASAASWRRVVALGADLRRRCRGRRQSGGQLHGDWQPRMLRPDGRGEALHVGLRHDHECPCRGAGACGLAGWLNSHRAAPRAGQERRR